MEFIPKNLIALNFFANIWMAKYGWFSHRLIQMKRNTHMIQLKIMKMHVTLQEAIL